jgi:predicted nucleotidyltransferase
MNRESCAMKAVIEKFIEELKIKDETLGILIFGSYARGDQRENSDVDVLVLVKDGAWRDVERRKDQVFEMVYASLDDCRSFYQAHPNDAVQQWNDGKIMFDRDGGMEKLKAFVSAIRNQGKKKLTAKQIAHFKFDAEDKVSAIEYLKENDFATANLYLQTLAQTLLELHFDLMQEWTPAPKQRLRYLRTHHAALSSLYDSFYTAKTFEEQFSVAKNIAKVTFDV